MTPLPDKADVLLERWKQEMQRLPLPAHVQVTEGEAREKVLKLASAVMAAVNEEEAASRFQAGGDAYGDAEGLGRLRRQQGFAIEELVQEHIIIRNEFWNVFHVEMNMKQAVDFHLEKRMNGCFDLMLQAAASAYHYEHSREMMENPLRDAETGLYNKSYFHGRMIEELRRSVRYEHDITLALLEISNYFALRDVDGSEQAGEIVRGVAIALERMTRDCDVVARLSEGGFAILLPETGWRGGKVMAERLNRYLQNEVPALVSGEKAPELRWGMASFPEEVRQPEKLYASAVEAMRSSHSDAPGEVVIFRGEGGGEGS
ncbi:MAG: diguanylate cyclase [Actinomycetota bacterium]|nr:diguanylate cyclase [Actinomycetota bacterium]MDD5665943.1 diguanylate cyclase [Actinomycetota bacterium]